MAAPRIPSLSALRAFEAAARHLSFTKAAKEIFITQGAVSYQIRTLEEAIGAPLFRREGRNVALTDEARQLVPVLQRAFEDIASAIAALSHNASKRGLTIALSTYFATHWLSRRLGGFWRQYPDIRLRLQHPETNVQLGRDEIDMAVFWKPIGWKAPAGFDEYLLFEAPVGPVCSPALPGGKGGIKNAADLHDHVLLRDDVTRNAWAAWYDLAGVDHPEKIFEMAINDPNVYIQAAIDGQGLALADSLIADEIALGRLIRPFDIMLPGYGYFFVCATNGVPNEVRAFRDWIVDESSGMRS